MSKMVKPVAVPSQRLRRFWDQYGMNHVPFRLLMVAKMMDRSISRQLTQDGEISLAEWRVLANLHRLEMSTVTELADAAQVDRAEVSRAVRSLEARGLVVKATHPASRAKKQLSLSIEGIAIARRIGIERRAFYAYVLEGLDDGQRQLFDDLMLHLATRVERYEQEHEGVPAVDAGGGPLGGEAG